MTTVRAFQGWKFNTQCFHRDVKGNKGELRFYYCVVKGDPPLRKPSWRSYLKGEKDAFKSLDANARAQLLFKIRKRAMQCFEDLILIFQGMHNITKNPDRQFLKIINDLEARLCYTEFKRELYKVDMLARFYKSGLSNPPSIPVLATLLEEAGIEYDLHRLYDKDYRLIKFQELHKYIKRKPHLKRTAQHVAETLPKKSERPLKKAIFYQLTDELWKKLEKSFKEKPEEFKDKFKMVEKGIKELISKI